MNLKKTVTLRQYIFADFDNDGVKNIDDPYPLDAKRRKVDWTEKQLQRSRWSDHEVLLSEQLMDIYKYNNKIGTHMGRVAEEQAKKGVTVKWRVKSIPSTLKKLKEKQMHLIGDLAAGKVLPPSREKARITRDRFRRRYRTRRKGFDDYYKKPKGGSYYAFHIGLRVPQRKNGKVKTKWNKKGFGGVMMEMQFKSKTMDDFNEGTHYDYKRGKNLDKYKKEAKRLYDLGF